MKTKLALFLVAAAIGAPLVADEPTAAGPPTTKLAISGTQFTLAGKPVFLLGISYYGGLGADEKNLKRDLDQIQAGGFNWLRVWATWAAFGTDVSAVDAEGRPRKEFFDRLRRLVAECDRRGLVVDVTLARGKGGSEPGRLQTIEAHERAVVSIVDALAAHGNWYLELANERNIGDDRHVSYDELATLRDLVCRLDPGRLVTASHGGDISQEEAAKYVQKVKVDFLTPHRPRHREAIAQTEAVTRELLVWAKEAGREMPVHYQEPLRRGYENYQPSADDLHRDLAGAKAGAAAGWCLHNGATRGVRDGRPRRSFDLTRGSLFDDLDPEEKRFIELLK